jgi:DNA-binding XRE family transcriptional regulator
VKHSLRYRQSLPQKSLQIWDWFVKKNRHSIVNPIDTLTGRAIRGLRYREELTQPQLAEKIGVKRHHISEMENGKGPIGRDMAKRLAKALHTDYKVFL